MRRVLLSSAAAVAAAAVSLAGGASAQADAEASAFVVVARVQVPGAPPISSTQVVAPPATTGGGPVNIPADGSLVTVGTSSAATAAQPGTSSSAEARAEALGISLFAGEIRARSISARASAAAGKARALAVVEEFSVEGLSVLGQAVPVDGPLQLPVADWGVLDLLVDSSTVSDRPPRSAAASTLGLRLELTADHGGYPAGTVVEILDLELSVAAVEDVAPTLGPDPGAPRGDNIREPPRRPPGVSFEAGSSIDGTPAEIVQPAPEVVARLSNGGYVFPVFGPASFGDSFGSYRGDVPGFWHHGEDIVAPKGTPILAVAPGTVFSVGWNEIGGWRLWLRDNGGNEFYYAHLSAYSPLAVDGTGVKAGDVLGFVGSTGDAEGGVPHLHFEIHPAELLALGYDGVVAPYPFLAAWRRAEDVSFGDGRRYVPADLPGSAPAVGAYLLEIDDIARTTGLVPGALDRALNGAAQTQKTG